MGAHPLFSTFSRRELNPIKLAYSPSPPDNGLGQYVSSPGNRAYCYAELAVSSLATAVIITSTHFAYPRRDGQAELPWVLCRRRRRNFFDWLIDWSVFEQTKLYKSLTCHTVAAYEDIVSTARQLLATAVARPSQPLIRSGSDAATQHHSPDGATRTDAAVFRHPVRREFLSVSFCDSRAYA